MRQDVISLRMIEFTKTLAHIAELKEREQWEDVIKVIGVNLNRLVRVTPQEFRRLTETGLLAQLIKDGPTVWVPYKKIMLIALLKETGDYATKKEPPRAGYGWYLKALHLLLDSLAHNEMQEYSELVPKVEVLLFALGESSMPVRTRLLLMREYERRRQFARVKDEFLAALHKSPNNVRLIDFGIACFERLAGESDVTLVAGGLPRSNINAILSELVAKRPASSQLQHT